MVSHASGKRKPFRAVFFSLACFFILLSPFRDSSSTGRFTIRFTKPLDLVYDTVYNILEVNFMNVTELLKSKTYYTLTDLRYNAKVGANLSSAELTELLDEKDRLAGEDADAFFRTFLEPFNSKHIFFVRHPELIDLHGEYLDLVNADDVFDSNFEEMRRARIYSEVEGSLNIEGYNSTRVLFDRLLAGKKPENRNETIIRNMADGIAFTEAAPPFTVDEFFRLYSILSRDCLEENQRLREGERYRYDAVYIADYNGAPVSDIPRLMDSLFSFVNDNLKNPDPLVRFLLPHIAHYYVVYVHPYFDCNGRMARMTSLWVANLAGGGNAPYFISEAINDRKREYYRALSRTRDARNDLTYFLLYILQVSVRYALCYRRLNEIRDRLAASGDSLSGTELNYLKRILLSADDRYFSWKEFTAFIRSDMTKQGALKFLNKFEKYGLLVSKSNKSREKVFSVKLI